ncbi:CYTH domain-containing protein [uncultured Marinobacter sp.]|uniref:CYTH domain-containing protein n=1 Tax=uncultured Marinobacter sp. TaxID=187379 RepID=UPI00262554E4|nr:CYTH domain-containing protein [uncultured Marinobacter sp.]
MAEELEIKLTLSAENQATALKWLLSQSGATEGRRKTLINRYFDTPEADLNRQRIALRVRQMGDHFIQTLKTQGEFVDGAHKRQEWEWPLMGKELNIGLVADTPVGQGVNLADLKPVFETNFERQIVMIEEGETVIEVAVDAGYIEAGGQRRPLHEVEFELKSGDASYLLQWARALADEVPVFLNLVSKAEQGYFLAGLHNPSILPADGEQALSVSGFLHGLSVAWLKGETLLADGDDLAEVGRLAGNHGTQPQFNDVRTSLMSGEKVARLAERGALGQLQLSIAAG